MCQITNQQPIGIFDSGVGGLSVLKAIRAKLPNENLIYLADSQFTPYGTRSNFFVEQRVKSIADFLISKECKAIVVACNTATAAAIKQLRERLPIPIVGLEPAIKPAIEASQLRRIGVLATKATLTSEKYLTLKQRLQNDCEIIEKASSLFVELVESAVVIDDPVKHLISDELQLFYNQIDALVLGCTHYPFLTEAISDILGPNVKLFESANPVANQLARCIDNIVNCSSTIGTIEYYSSEPAKAQTSFDRILNQSVTIWPM